MTIERYTYKMSILFYDLETKGEFIPENDKIIQIAYYIWNPLTNEEKYVNKIFNDGNNDVDFYKKLEHEIKNGIHPSTVVQEIYIDFKNADKIVSYSNSCFDETRMNIYFKKYGYDQLTFQNRINIMNIYSNYFAKQTGKYKPISLKDAYSHFNTTPTEAHLATNDVEMLVGVYNHLIAIGIPLSTTNKSIIVEKEIKTEKTSNVNIIKQLTFPEINIIAINAGLKLKETLSKNEWNDICAKDQEKNYYSYKILTTGYCPTLIFFDLGSSYQIGNSSSSYTINLNTLKPTSKSPIKKEVPVEIRKKYFNC